MLYQIQNGYFKFVDVLFLDLAPHHSSCWSKETFQYLADSHQLELARYACEPLNYTYLRAVLLAQISWRIFTVRRCHIAESYHAGIANSAVQLLSPPAQVKSPVYHLFVVLCQERDRFGTTLNRIRGSNSGALSSTCSSQLPTKALQRDPNGLRVAEKHAAQCLSIPCHPQMSEENIAKVIDSINAFK